MAEEKQTKGRKRKQKGVLACPHCGQGITIGIVASATVHEVPRPSDEPVRKPNLAQGPARADGDTQRALIKRLQEAKSVSELELILDEAARLAWRPDMLAPINEAYVEARGKFQQ